MNNKSILTFQDCTFPSQQVLRLLANRAKVRVKKEQAAPTACSTSDKLPLQVAPYISHLSIGGEGGRGDNRYNCEKIIFPISVEEILLQLEHKFSDVFVEPASEAKIPLG